MCPRRASVSTCPLSSRRIFATGMGTADVLAPLLDERLNEEGRASDRVKVEGKGKLGLFGIGVEGTVKKEPGEVKVDEGCTCPGRWRRRAGSARWCCCSTRPTQWMWPISVCC